MSNKRNYLIWIAGALTALALSVSCVLGQENPDSTEPTRHLFQVTISAGSTLSGPATDIENAMPTSGFSQPESHAGIGGIGLPWILSARYSIRPNVSVGFLISNAPIGKTQGHHADDLNLTVHYSVLAISPTVSFIYEDFVRAGIGPAVYITKSAQSTPSDLIETRTATKIGVLLDFGLSLPLFDPFVADLGFQYRFVGTSDIGPFTANSSGQPAATMPLTSGNYSHALVSLGIGIQL